MSKSCLGCKKIKNLEEFNFKDKKNNYRASRCKNCTRKQIREHYFNNKEYYKIKAKNYHKLVVERNQKFVCDYLSLHPCVDCGETDIVVLEFDHQENKDIAVCNMLVNSSLQRIINEIKKCQVRCANCHRRRTSQQFGYYRTKFALLV